METLSERIMEHAAGLAEGVPLGAKGLLHLGSRAAVDQALSRLARAEKLLRLGRGLYVLPVASRFGVRPPTLTKVVEGIASMTGETVASHGAAAANAFGLTTQVPVRSVFLTSGRTRRLTLGAQVVELRHAPAWQLTLAARPAGAALRALAWLGPREAERALPQLESRLSPTELKEMMAARSRLPTWMAKTVSALSECG